MIKPAIILYVIISCFFLFSAHGQEPGIFTISSDSVELSGPWKYNPGDDLSWADPDFDDSEWSFLSTHFEDPDSISVWEGMGWFRARLDVDSALLHKPLALLVQQIGASEIYLNGELISSLGKVGASPDSERNIITQFSVPPIIIFYESTNNVIAVRFSNHRAGEIIRERGVFGFILTLMPSDNYLPWFNKMAIMIKRYQIFFTSAALAIALIHLFLFIFHRKARENLYFAILAFSIAGLAYAPYAPAFVESYRQHLLLMGIFKFSLVLTAIFGSRFLYSIFYEKLPRQFWIILFAGIVMLLLSRWLSVYEFYFFVAFPLIEMLRVVTVAVFRKKPGARIVAIGFAALILLSFIQMAQDTYQIHPASEFFMFTYLYGILLFLIFMSIYLARNFARTKKDLELQLNHVKELSEKTLEQEREAKQQQMKQVILETEIAHRKKELEEARKLSRALSELEKAHSELKNAQTQLVQSEKMASLGMLVAGIAHEINTPIGAVNSMHDTLVRSTRKLKDILKKSAAFDDEGDNRLSEILKIIDDANKVIQSGTDRVTTIVRRLRSFARLDEAELKTVDIHEGIEDTLTILHHEIKHNITITRKYGSIPKVACYPGQLNQVFLNLLINASQAIEGKGNIIISTYSKNSKVLIEIADDGPGIPPENIDRVFDPGFTTKGVGVGTGLGLSICYQIIENHHGKIEVESEPGKGSKFIITLPTNLDKIIENSQF
ncbi:MAG: beta galactosidase jelly roll domain-containing protein [Candidatus Zixiibacteriota bacterium]|nr:MAG: beta galactosidase jelly roll domain-containing protein [candidate division Zixibacteria bacterium]